MTTDNLWEDVTSGDALSIAWSKVDSNEGSAGGDGVTRDEFRRDRYSRLTQLRADLLSGDYEPRPYRKVSIPKKKPGYRLLTIPSLRDRVLHTSIATALTPILEPKFEECSFAYRPGRGVTQAVRRIEHWRDRGYNVVIEADIVSYFDNIVHDILLEKLKSALDGISASEPLLALLAGTFKHQGRALGTEGVGLVQGSPLSPILANLYLDALDEEMESDGVKLVRFADDFVILCKSNKKAEKALAHCAKVLERHQLRLHEDGTRIVNFEKGFDFVGYLFLRTLALKEQGSDRPKSTNPVKSEVTEDGIIQLDDRGSNFDQGHRVLYVLDPSHKLTTRNKSFSVCRDDGTELIAIANRRVGRIEIGANVGFDRGAVMLAIESGTPFAILDGFGQTKGTIENGLPKKAGLHLAQAKSVLSDELRLELAKSIVHSRIHNQRVQLFRLNRRQKLDDVIDALKGMKSSLAKLTAAASVEQLMGLEGAASADYWRAIGLLVGEKNFLRTRPGREPVSSTINYLTGILERDIRAAVHTVGLHTGFAMLHGTRDRHEGLIFDMMEPFRAALTEGLGVYMFTSRRLAQDHFAEANGGTFEISTTARQAIVSGYEGIVGKRVNRPDGKGQLAWRAQMVQQCRSLARAITNADASQFEPYLMEA